MEAEMRKTMRVEIKIDPDIEEHTAVIHVPKMTQELMALVEMLKQTEKPSLLFAKSNNKLFVIEPEQIDIIRTEGNDIKLYNREAQEYIITKPLREIGEQLGGLFVRISKSTLVNIKRVDYLSPSFNSTMYIVMKNGISDYITRKHLNDFKSRLGL
jgi:DNA-binding LytR/AlgR family response regulator